MNSIIKVKISFFALLFIFVSCESLETVNNNNPDRTAVLSSGTDLLAVLNGAYLSWWQGVHSDHFVMAMSISSDTYGMSWDDFGARRMGEEPRLAYNNRSVEDPDYKKIVEAPWYGCLTAVSSANDVLSALENGVTIDKGGPQDQSIRAAAHFLRGLSWGYLGLIFDQALLVDEETNLEKELPFTAYQEMIVPAVAELEEAVTLAELAGINFIHPFFNGLTLDVNQFVQLSHSYAARFLAQWPRTALENSQVNWQAVLNHAEKGLETNFAPIADGNFWKSYHQYVFAETGQGPFWARVDQRLIAALDHSQPFRYPEVVALEEPPLANPMAQSNDARLASDFIFRMNGGFPVENGEWHFSHYQHNRNVSDPGFAGDGETDGPMPVFLAADNDLLEAEALLRLGRSMDAVAVLNAGTRVNRGGLPVLIPTTSSAEVERAILYERAIELLGASPMGLWFDRRRVGPRLDFNAVDDLGGLQIGTPAQLPVPADELMIHGLPPYNFGGERDPEGIIPIF